jgi:hypothetical protein
VGATLLRSDDAGDEKADFDERVEVGGFVVSGTWTRKLLSGEDLRVEVR